MDNTKKRIYPKCVNRILAVSIGGLGDTILFSPVLRALYSFFPCAQLELMVTSKQAQAVYSAAKEINRAILVNTNRPLTFQKVVAVLPYAIKARFRGGFDLGVFATGLNPRFKLLLKFTVGIRSLAPFSNHLDHETDLARNVALARLFDPAISEEDVFIPLTGDSQEEAKEVLRGHGISLEGDEFMAVYPSKELWHRPRWDLAKLAQVVGLLRRKGFKGKVLVLGSADEGREWKTIKAGGEVDAVLAGKLSILGSAWVLSKSRLTLGNDGGLMHVAGAVGCPVAVIMTSTPLSYKPPGGKTRVIHSGMRCCDNVFPRRPKSCRIAECKKDITVNQVYRVCADLLNKAG